MKRVLGLFAILIIVSVFWMDTAYAQGPLRKLGRGLANIVTGWTELPITISQNYKKRGHNIAGAFYGLPVGIVRGVSRTAIGVYEIVTFPLPIPEHYKPIMEPEFVTESHPGFESMD